MGITTDHEQATDEDLVEAARAGDDQALAEVLRRFRPGILAKARLYFVSGGDRQDVIQEGMIGLYKAVRDFDPQRQPTFRHFADLCITRQVITAIKGATRRKHAPLNSYVSLHATIGGGDDEDDATFVDRLTDDASDPGERTVEAWDLQALREWCHETLSTLETEVLDRYVAGESYADIADHVGRQVKAVDNAVQRIKRKLELYLEERAVAC